jgi:hypothetical protein
LPKAECVLGFEDLRADRGEFDLIDEIAGFSTLQYEHLYRALIDDGGALEMETARFRDIYNRIRPHQSPGERTPGQAYLGNT